MRFYAIALFIFTFNMFLGLLQDPAFGIVSAVANDTTRWNVTEITQINISAQNTDLMWGDVFAGVSTFINIVGRATVYLGQTLGQLGLPSQLVYILGSLSWMSYLAGGIQILRGVLWEK